MYSYALVHHVSNTGRAGGLAVLQRLAREGSATQMENAAAALLNLERHGYKQPHDEDVQGSGGRSVKETKVLADAPWIWSWAWLMPCGGFGLTLCGASLSVFLVLGYCFHERSRLRRERRAGEAKLGKC